MNRKKRRPLLAWLMVLAMLCTMFPPAVLAAEGPSGGAAGPEATVAGATYSVTADSAISGGSVAVNPDSGNEGDTITVTVTPDEGKQLAAGSLKYSDGSSDTEITATEGIYSFVLPAANVTVTAQFEDIPAATYPVDFSVSGENGSLTAAVDSLGISSGDAVAAGKTVVFTAAPAAGCQVKQWTVDSQAAADNKTNTLTLENLAAATAVTVEFEAVPVTGSTIAPADFTDGILEITQGGTYTLDTYTDYNAAISSNPLGWWIKVATTDPVTIAGTGCDLEMGRAYNRMSITGTVAGIDLTVEDLFIESASFESCYTSHVVSTSEGEYDMTDICNVLNFTGAGNKLTIEGRNCFEAKSGGAAIHVGPTADLTVDGDGALYLYKTGAWTCIGGNGCEANGAITINGGDLFIKGSKMGAVIGSGSYCGDIPGDITINGGTLNLVGNARGAVFGTGAQDRNAIVAGNTDNFPASTGNVYVNGGLININVDFGGAAIGQADAAGSPPIFEIPGNLYVTGGSIRTFLDQNALSFWNMVLTPQLPSFGVYPVAITAAKTNGSGEPVYMLALDTTQATAAETYSVNVDGEEYYSGGLYQYCFVQEAKDKGEQHVITTTVSNWVPSADPNLYLYLTGEDHTLTINGETFEAIWNSENQSFAVGSPGSDYTVTVDDGISGGSIAVDPATGNAGATVTVTVTPEDGKQLVAGSLKYNDGGSDTEITETDGVYSFVLPAANVAVTAQFESIPTSTVWDGSIDVTWYNPTDTVFYIDTPAKLAGLAAIVNGIYNEGADLIGDSSYIVPNVGLSNGKTELDGSSDTWIYGADDFTGKTVRLTADLDMGGVYDSVSGTWSGPNYMPVGGQYCMTNHNAWTLLSSSWNGAFDGQGHTVKNINCDRYSHVQGINEPYKLSQSIGLIGRLGVHDGDPLEWYTTPSVKNVAVTGYIYGRRSVGGIVGKSGRSNGSIIENCINYAFVKNTDAKGCGGITGAGWNRLTIINCANLGQIYTSYDKTAGGISGSCEAQVYNCYNVGYVGAGITNAAQSLGTNNGGAVWTNCYWLDGSSASNQAVYGNTVGSTITKMDTTDSMKTADFLAALNGDGRAWVADTNNINSGYPIPRSWITDTSTVTGIIKESDPAKLNYEGGETFDPAGLVIWANYSDNTREKVTDYTISKTTPLESTDTSITISGSHDGMAYSYDLTITVTGNSLQSIAITSPPKNCLYAAGEYFDSAGMVVRATYGDGMTSTLTAGQYTVTPGVFAPGDDKVTISYTSSGITRTVDQPLTVLASAAPVLNEDVYELSSADHMLWFANQVNIGLNKGIKGKLTQDIDLSGVIWTPIGNSYAQSYTGFFDGNGKTVTLAISGSADYSGLFGSLQGAAIKDLTVAGSVSGSASTAGIAAAAQGSSLLRNCVNNAAVTGAGAGSSVGGIVAIANQTVTISNCINNGDISSASYRVGGVIGMITSGSVVVTGCANTGAVSGAYHVGGIVGESSGNDTVNNCLNTGAVTATSTATDSTFSVGGVVGYTKHDVTIDQCANRGAVSGGVMNVGGVVGYLNGPSTMFTNSYNTGSVTSASSSATAHTGGVVGRMNNAACTVKNTYNAGIVTGNGTSPNTAGVIGYAAGNTNVSNNCYLNTTAAKGLGNAADNTAGKTSDELKSAGFLADLNGNGRFFVADTNNSNSGYPILRVMTGDTSALISITKDSDPSKLSYIEGLTFDPAGLAIWANYSDGTREKVTDYTISKTTALETTDTTITVSGTRGGMPYSYDFTITVAGPPAIDGNNVYQLATADEMIWFANQVNAGLNTAIKGKLMQDIDLSAVTWNPIGNSSPMAYTGILDGNGKTVTLAISGAANFSGLFGYVDGGTVKNLTVAGSVSGGQYTAGIVAYALGAAVIENCVNNANVTGAYHVGGIVGNDSGSSTTISKCANNGTITATSTATTATNGVGGIMGRATAATTIDQCHNSGPVNGSVMSVGGVVGCLINPSATVTNSYNTGSVTSTSASATARTGGVVGTSTNAACTVQNTYNAGIVTGNGTSPNTAGVIGYAAGITNVSNNYYLDTASDKAIGFNTTYTAANAASKTAAELKALAATLGASYKDGTVYPILTWQTAVSPETYTVTVDNTVSGGSITVDPVSGNAGATVTVTVTPDEGKQLVAGSLKYNDGSSDTEITATEGIYSFILPAANVTVTAQFEDIPAATYPVNFSVSGENGSLTAAVESVAISSGDAVTVGKTVVFTAAPAAGYQVKQWTVDSQAAADNRTNTLTVENLAAATTVTVEFEVLAPDLPVLNGDIYELSTADHMLWFANQVNTDLNKGIKGKLMQDIDLSAVTWNPIGNSNLRKYAGTFDGNGKTVTLAISGTADYLGLFGYVDDGTIKNLNVAGSVSGGKNIGGIAAYPTGATVIENCVNNASVTSTSQNAGGIAGYAFSEVVISGCTNNGAVSGTFSVGGIAGLVQKACTISKCANTGAITATGAGAISDQSVGGIVGSVSADHTVIDQCHNSGAVNGGVMIMHVGGVVGRLSQTSAKVTNCYNTGSVTSTRTDATARTGGVIGSVNNNNCTVQNTYNAGEISVSNTGQYTAGVIGYVSINHPVSNNYYLDTTAAKGLGNEQDNAVRKTSDELKSSEFLTGLNGDGRFFVADTNGSNSGYPILRAMTGDTSTLISITKGSDPSKLSYIEGLTFDPAGLAIWANYSDGTREKVTDYTISKTTALEITDTTITVSGTHGGMPYNFEFPITVAGPPAMDGNNVYQLATADEMIWFANQVNAGLNTAIKGKLMQDIDLSAVTWKPIGSSSSRKYAGAFDGNGKTVTLGISGTANSGLFGYVDGGTVKDLIVAGSVSGALYTAGIVANAMGATVIENCVNNASVTSTSNSVGGIAGRTAATSAVNNCVNNGNVSGSYYVGGIVGNNSGTCAISRCVNIGTITATSTATSTGYGVGGIAGYAPEAATIDQCHNSGAVSGSVMNVGGVVGYLNNASAKVTNSYNTGSVTSTSSSADACTGGVVGTSNHADCTVQNTYNAGSITGNGTSPNTAGVIGYAAGNTNVSNNYYLDTTASIGIGNAADNTVSKTSSELRALAPILGEAFKTGNVYPILNWQADETQTFSVTVDGAVTGGTVAVDPVSAAAGETITVTVTPDEGKQLVAGSLKYNDGAADIEIAATDGVYSFVLPAADVTVTARFEDISTDPRYMVIPVTDESVYTVGETGGIKTMTVKAGVGGLKYFGAQLTPVIAHAGKEAVVFTHLRDGAQLSLNITKADFDLVGQAQAGFNVQAGDTVKVYIVDDLTNDVESNPTLLQ